MYNDYRDMFPPGSVVKNKKDHRETRTIADVDAIVNGTTTSIKDWSIYKRYPNYLWFTIELDSEGYRIAPGKKASVNHIRAVYTGIDEWELIEGSISIVALCKCPWNKHPLFCRCQ